MLEYEFERVDRAGGMLSFSWEFINHQEIIRKRAAEGWRFAGWVQVTQIEGFIKTIDLVFERETAEQE